MPNIVIRPIDIDRDAEGLAAMWTASALEWPDGTPGVPATAQMVRHWEQEERLLVAFVAEVDGEIAGYCSFAESGRYRGEGYLPSLNVHPKYQRLGLGRRLIRATIERSVQEGWQRQSLGTWSSNFKAVRLYKKTGHFWTPDSDPWMQNYIPGALQLPLAKPFFERHDWYDCLVRELTQEEDDQRWEGLKVFTQHWEADGESLTIWIDRQARAPVAVETDELLVAAIAGEVEPLAGSKVNLRWRVVNKGGKPLSVHLHALGDKGLSIDHREAFLVPAGETVERRSQVEVAHDAPQEKKDGAAPAVRSILHLDDQEVELFSGLKPKKPVTLKTTPAQVTLPPGLATPIRLELHSELDRPVAATLRLTLPEGLAADWAIREVELPAKGRLAVPLELTGAEEAVYRLPVCVQASDSETFKSLAETLTFFCLGPGGLLSHREGSSVRLETDALRVTVEAKGGTIKVEHKASRLTKASLGLTVGPPYWPSELEGVELDVALEERGGRAVVHLAGEARHHPGLYLHQELALSPTGLSTLRCRLENRGGQQHAGQLGLQVGSSDRDRERTTLPLHLGMVQSPSSAYPTEAWDDAPRDPAAYREPWLAWERDGLVAGVAWGESVETIQIGWRAGFLTGELLAPPGERSDEVSFAFYVGDGDWRDLRRQALRWSDGWNPEEETPAPRPPTLARVEPIVLATTSHQVEGRLIVDTASVRPASGQVTVTTDEAVSVEPRTVPVTGLVRGKAVERDLRFALPGEALGVFAGEVRLELPLVQAARAFHLVRLGKPGPVEVRRGARSGQEVWTIDNGANAFVVAPGFGPSVIAWRHEGPDQLYSPFPEPQGSSWLYPWLGGIHSVLLPLSGWAWESRLSREKAVAEPIEAVDTGGLAWQGLRLKVRPTKEKYKDLEVELDYLTLGDADLLKYVCRVRNLRATEQAVKLNTAVACRLGAKPTELVLHGEDIRRKPTTCCAQIAAGQWGALSNHNTGRTMLVVSQRPDVGLWDAGQHGRVLTAGGLVRLAGEQVHERVYYLVLADSLEGDRGYRVLKDYAG